MATTPMEVYSWKPGGLRTRKNLCPQDVGLPIYADQSAQTIAQCLYRILPVVLGSSGNLTIYDSNNTNIPVAVAGMTNGSASITGVNGFVANTPVFVTGTVPLPYLVLTQYYVSATGLSNAAFQLATTVGGTPAAVTGSTGNVGVSPGIVTTFTNGSASLSATAHGLAAGNKVTLTGTVPLPYITNTSYYVSATGLTANAYQLALLPSTINATATPGLPSSASTPQLVTGSTTTVNVANLNHLGNEVGTWAYNALTVGLPLTLEAGLSAGLVLGAAPVASQYSITVG